MHYFKAMYVRSPGCGECLSSVEQNNLPEWQSCWPPTFLLTVTLLTACFIDTQPVCAFHYTLLSPLPLCSFRRNRATPTSSPLGHSPTHFHKGCLRYRLQDAKYWGGRAHIPALRFFPKPGPITSGCVCFLTLIRG